MGHWLPYQSWLNAGDNAWQMTAATFVGLMSLPGLAVLYGGVMQKRWSVNSMMLTFVAFSVTLVVWCLWGFKMGFGQSIGRWRDHSELTASSGALSKPRSILGVRPGRAGGDPVDRHGAAFPSRSPRPCLPVVFAAITTSGSARCWGARWWAPYVLLWIRAWPSQF
jgi:hypothetical protein